jgi:hypothetical protein
MGCTASRHDDATVQGPCARRHRHAGPVRREHREGRYLSQRQPECEFGRQPLHRLERHFGEPLPAGPGRESNLDRSRRLRERRPASVHRSGQRYPLLRHDPGLGGADRLHAARSPAGELGLHPLLAGDVARHVRARASVDGRHSSTRHRGIPRRVRGADGIQRATGKRLRVARRHGRHAMQLRFAGRVLHGGRSRWGDRGRDRGRILAPGRDRPTRRRLVLSGRCGLERRCRS